MGSLGSMLEPPKLDSLFGDDKKDAGREKITYIPLEEAHRFADHPYRVLDDEAMQEMAESIKERGVLVPAIVRPRAEGGYEIVAGHRRKRACELAGMKTMPAIVREMDNDTAVIIMVDSNLQREDILPSEKAKAFKMKYEALQRKRGRPMKENSSQLETNFLGKRADEEMAENTGESRAQIHRILRLNELEPNLLDMVDSKTMAFNPAVELSFLQPEEQAQLADLLKCEERTPSLSQAQRLKQLSQQGELSEDKMLAVMAEPKPQQKVQIVLKEDRLTKYFPKSFTPRQMEEVIIKLLEVWHRKREQEMER